MDSLDTSPNVQPTTLASSGLEVRFSFDNTYARLPEHFYARLDPTPVAAPRLVKVNVELARELVKAFIGAKFSGEERHLRRLAKVDDIEAKGA